MEGEPVALSGYDSAATIRMISHAPRELRYESNASSEGLAVFSEIYYPIGWKATIDGQEAKIMQANYVLRALRVPPGKHTIVFRFDPPSYEAGNAITTVFSWLVIVILLASIGWSLRRQKALALSSDKP